MGDSLIDQLQVCLVHQRRRLQGVPRAFAPQVRVGNAAELFIYETDQLIPGLLVAVAPVDEELGDRLRTHQWHF
jgi:hypothetical protein